MSIQLFFFCENGKGHIVDEHEVEPMDLIVEEELFAIETVSCRTRSLMNKPPERPSSSAMHPAADERNSEDVDMKLCNK